MNILASINEDILTSVFGWDRNVVADEVSKLASKIDITKFRNQQDTFSTVYVTMFSDVSQYLCNQLSFINRKQVTSISASEAADFKTTNGGAADTFYIVDGSRNYGGTNPVWMETLFKATEDTPFIEGLLKELVNKRTDMMYELITQIYLHQALLSYDFMSVPRLIAVRKTHKYKNHPGNVYAFMERVQAPFLKKLAKDIILIALAHLMKCLFILQRKYHFMHRDLHHQNVAYDATAHTIHFIDFGHSCVNPNFEDIAWQPIGDFYPITFNSLSAKCDNPSLDVCCIIASLADSHPFCLQMNEEMKAAFTEKLKVPANQGHVALQNLSEKANDLFTLATDKEWKVGNKLNGGAKHWWVYDMGEVPYPKFYPEHMLTRLLEQIPLEEWPPIRKSFADVFDVISPKCRVSYKGNDGTIQELKHDDNFKVTFDKGGELILPANELERITKKQRK
jgi:serine/threonine protein kinase